MECFSSNEIESAQSMCFSPDFMIWNNEWSNPLSSNWDNHWINSSFMASELIVAALTSKIGSEKRACAFKTAH